ncbi:MAG: SGNH/GDSL hydrolase family protein [Candidatus Competibacterales bacterium]
MNHVVLLGDSIFDNASYVSGEPSVIEQLRGALAARAPSPWEATLLAVDGDVIVDVSRQLAKLPADASHLVVSCGGNDALGYSHVLRRPVATVGEACLLLDPLCHKFRGHYRQMVAHLRRFELPVVLCTVYNAVPGLGRDAYTALALFNEIILHEAAAAGLSVLDLRLVCAEVEDYSPLSPVEPSARGGEKIAQALTRCLLAGENDRPCCHLYR